jgi:hypothetical protein
VDVAEQARRVRVMCAAYGSMDPAAVVDEITDRFRRGRAWHAANDRPRGVAAFDECLAWMERNAEVLNRQPPEEPRVLDRRVRR